MKVSASVGSRLRFDVFVLAVWAIGLGACANHISSAPVVERGISARQPTGEFREVVAGDTLYSIAWESGRDYRELAAWNGISPPYTIRPGQRIRLQPSASAPGSTVPPTAATHTVQRGETLYGIASRYDLTAAGLAVSNGINPPYTIRPGQVLRLVDAGGASTSKNEREEKPTTHETTPKPQRPAVARAIPNVPVSTWTWPTEGKMLSRFRASGSKGIDIGGKPGQPILAAAPGTVVYQGSGLRGYGQLIIVKHNRDFLSAYAHCSKIVVREGNVIQRGQKIAEMGNTGTDRVKLHFEIRFRGNPVDPLDHLPKK